MHSNKKKKKRRCSLTPVAAGWPKAVLVTDPKGNAVGCVVVATPKGLFPKSPPNCGCCTWPNRLLPAPPSVAVRPPVAAIKIKKNPKTNQSKSTAKEVLPP